MKVVEGGFGKKEEEIPKSEQVNKLMNLLTNEVIPEEGYDEVVVVLSKSDGTGTSFATNIDLVGVYFLLGLTQNIIMSHGDDLNEVGE